MKTNEFVIELNNNPGELARLCDLVGNSGVNLKAITTDRVGSQTFVRILVDKEEKTRKALEENNWIFSENEVIVKAIDDTPNALTEVARKLGASGINIEAIYLLNKGHQKVNLVFALDNPQQGAEILKD